MTEQSSAKSIRWYSTVESAENLEFSVLAVLESICAVSLSLWLTWYFQSYTHVIVAIVLAPLLLLRTEESTQLGLKWFGNSLVWFGKIFSQDGKQKIPTNMFTALFAVARSAGWIAQWKEMMEEPNLRIGRPRQLYTGAAQRNYIPMDQRAK